MSHEPRPGILILCCLGLLTGVLSGTFGVGGGIILVPALVALLHFDRRRAAGTSVAAILPTAVVGSVSYAAQGQLDVGMALCLAVGAAVGAQLGSYLLSRLPTRALTWSFIIFLAVVAVSLWFVIPNRGTEIHLDLLAVVLLIVTGAFAGVLSGLLGVGGGVVVVPILMLAFAASDLTAKGASLFMMIPGAVSGTIGNTMRKNVDLRAAAALGIAASAASPFGAILAATLSPFIANIAFSVLLAAICVQMAWSGLRREQRRDDRPQAQ
mgnify:CR=1 FL=1